MVLQGVNYLVPLMVLPYLMTVLHAEGYGYFAFAVAVCQYLMILVDFGFNLSATKRVALVRDNPDRLNHVFSATVFAKVILLAAAYLILLLIGLIPRFEVYRQTMQVMFLMVVGNTFVFVFLFQGLSKIRWVAVITSISKLLVLPLTFWLVKSPEDCRLAALLQGLVNMVAAVFSVAVVYKKGWARMVRCTWSEVATELSEGFPIFVSTVATSVYATCFTMILGYFGTPESVGMYASVERLMRALCCLSLVPVMQTFYPRLSKLSHENWEGARRLFRVVFGCEMVVLALSAVLLVVFAPYAGTVLGENYSGTTVLFRISAVIPLFFGVGVMYGQLGLLAMGDRHCKKMFQYIYMTVALIALVLVFALAPSYQEQGAMVALTITEVLVAVGLLQAYLRYVRKRKGMPA